MSTEDDFESQPDASDDDETPRPVANTDERKKLYFEWLERYDEIENYSDYADDTADRWRVTHVRDEVYLPGFGFGRNPRQVVWIRPVRGATFTSRDPLWTEFKQYNDRVVRTLARLDAANRGGHTPDQIADVVPSYLLSGAIPMRAATMIYGHRKHGKSAWLHKLSLCVITAGQTLDGEAIKNGRVLFKTLDPDADEAITKYRMNLICSRMGISLNKNIVIDDTPINLLDPLSVDAFLAKNSGRFRMIVIDPLYRAVNNRDPSRPEVASPLMESVKQMYEATGAAVVISHHEPRGGGRSGAHPYGSVFIEAGLSGLMHIVRGANDKVTLTPEWVKNGTARGPMTYELQEAFLAALDREATPAATATVSTHADMLASIPTTPTLISKVRKLIEHLLTAPSPSGREKEWERIRAGWERAGLVKQKDRMIWRVEQ